MKIWQYDNLKLKYYGSLYWYYNSQKFVYPIEDNLFYFYIYCMLYKKYIINHLENASAHEREEINKSFLTLWLFQIVVYLETGKMKMCVYRNKWQCLNKTKAQLSLKINHLKDYIESNLQYFTKSLQRRFFHRLG